MGRKDGDPEREFKKIRLIYQIWSAPIARPGFAAGVPRITGYTSLLVVNRADLDPGNVRLESTKFRDAGNRQPGMVATS